MKKFLAKIYAYCFLDHFILIYPVYALLFESNGLSPLQIASLFAAWSIITIVFEVPTGIIADSLSRRNILIFAQTLKGLAYIIWLVGGSYWFFFAGFALWGLAGTLVSGTFEAFVYDELKHHKQEKKYEKVNGKIAGTRSVGITLAVLLGGFASEFGFAFALVPSIIVPILAAALLYTLISTRRQQSTGERAYLKLLKSALVEAWKKPQLLRIIAFYSLVFGIYGASNEWWPLFFNDLGISLTVIGIFFAIANGTAAIAGYTAHLWKLEGNKVYAFVLLSSLPILALAVLQTTWAIIFSFISVYAIQVAATKLEVRLQNHIASNQRATVTSLNNFLLEVFALVFYISAGLLANQFGHAVFLWIFGGSLGLIVIFFLLTKATKKRSFAFGVN